MELIDLANFVIISQMTLLWWSTFLLRSLTVTVTWILFRIYFILVTLVFVLQRFFLHWEILIMLFSQFPLTVHQTGKGMLLFTAQLDYSCADTRMIFMIIWEMPHGKISLNLVLLLQVLNFVIGSKLQLIYIYPSS